MALRGFIREALDLDPVPTDLKIPPQGPTRPGGGGGKGGGGGVMAGGAGMGMGMGMGLGAGTAAAEESGERR